MRLQFQLGEQIQGLTLAERADHSCRLAKRLEKGGEYDAAREALSEFWANATAETPLPELEPASRAWVLLRVGALAGWLGSANLSDGSQEAAKNLITKSLEIFQQLPLPVGIAEAYSDLALCYWREGAVDEARINIARALHELGNRDDDQRATILIRASMIDLQARHLSESLRILHEAAPLVAKSSDSAIKGTFHNQLAIIYRKTDRIDQALIEYSAASFHFEQAGNHRFLAHVENNLGHLFVSIGRFKDGHTHLDRARRVALENKDASAVAQVDDSRARAFLDEGRLREAERCARGSVQRLEKGDHQAMLSEALTTYGIILARMGNHTRSRTQLQRAIQVAEVAGDHEGAGVAHLSIIEEMGKQTSATELVSTYKAASELLKSSQDPSTTRRLIEDASTVIRALQESSNIPDPEEAPVYSWEGFSFREKINSAERALIERALRDANGSVTRAARLLGFNHHQSLISLINSRHQKLHQTRTAVRKRRRHIFSQSETAKTAPSQTAKIFNQVSILHASDDERPSEPINDILFNESWRVELCPRQDALNRLAGNKRIDLLLIDHEGSGSGGIDLIKHARQIAHRPRLPIVMVSADDCETEARRAGVDSFLRSDQISELASTVSRLLKEDEGKL